MKATEIYISETPSTNALLKSYIQDKKLKDFTVLYTDHQTQGRGQMGSSWSSAKGKNIACSVYKEFNGISISDQFIISMLVSLALIDVLEELKVPKLKVKWPNDLYSSNKKIAGVLIETTMSGTKLSSAVIGIGLNLNQKEFEGLPHASSVLNLTGKLIDRTYVLQLILEKLASRFKMIPVGFQQIKAEYESHLYRKDKVSLFKGEQIGTINGIIKGINEKGQLLIDIDQQGVLKFNLKEVELLSSN